MFDFFANHWAHIEVFITLAAGAILGWISTRLNARSQSRKRLGEKRLEALEECATTTVRLIHASTEISYVRVWDGESREGGPELLTGGVCNSCGLTVIELKNLVASFQSMEAKLATLFEKEFLTLYADIGQKVVKLQNDLLRLLSLFESSSQNTIGNVAIIPVDSRVDYETVSSRKEGIAKEIGEMRTKLYDRAVEEREVILS